MSKLNEIEQAIGKLAETPHISTQYDEVYQGLRVIPVARKGVITLSLMRTDKSVFIVSITYAGGNWGGQLPQQV